MLPNTKDSTASLSSYIGQQITLVDRRTGGTYTATVADVVKTYGRIRMNIHGSPMWFEPDPSELRSLKQ